MKARDIKAVILDMDGVLWRSNKPLVDLASFFNHLKHRGWKFSLATNNSTTDVLGYLGKLESFGVAVRAEQIINSSQAAVHVLKSRFSNGARVYVVGETGLANTLSMAGFNIVEQGAEAVVAGLDRGFSYDKLALATSFIRAGALFVATNPDKTFPSSNGIQPGAGSIIAAIQAATDVEPLYAGKPQPDMYQVALERMGVSAQETLVIGDRLETDIAGAQNLGCLSALVLSGITTRDEAERWSPAPDWIAADLDDLMEML